MIRTFSEILKHNNYPKTPKFQNINNIQKTCKEASNEKFRKQTIVRIINIENDIVYVSEQKTFPKQKIKIRNVLKGGLK